MKKAALTVAGFVFALVGILHIIRYGKALSIVIGSFTIPMDWSLYGAAVSGILALWMFFAAIQK